MTYFDAQTLALVNALFNVFAGLVWLLLALLFRVAPGAGLLLAAAHLMRVASVRCDDCITGVALGTGHWFSETCSLLTVAFLCLGVRRLLRLRFKVADVVVLCAAFVPGVVIIGLQGHDEAALRLSSLGIALLALLLLRDMMIGACASAPAGMSLALSLPYVLLAGVASVRAAVLLLTPDSAELFMQDGQASPLLDLVRLGLAAMIFIGLITLVANRLVQRITQLSRTDPLTGALNRRALSHALHGMQGLLRRGHPYSVVMLDIDHFKGVNDRWGHAGGDAVLKHVVALMRAGKRPDDVVGRLGGEEFVLLLPHTDERSAAVAAERLRAELERRPCPWQSELIRVRASLGVAEAGAGTSHSELVLAAADAALYRAKHLGRNRVCVAVQGDAAPDTATGLTT